jgi:NADH:ubiquinone oxidoreductase subunit 5 (subunit L)/multisubunit Na+/H+ antiporter MnhA subunit
LPIGLAPLAVAAAIFHIINHATFKAALFMIAGIIDHETGTEIYANSVAFGNYCLLLPP